MTAARAADAILNAGEARAAGEGKFAMRLRRAFFKVCVGRKPPVEVFASKNCCAISPGVISSWEMVKATIKAVTIVFSNGFYQSSPPNPSVWCFEPLNTYVYVCLVSWVVTYL